MRNLIERLEKATGPDRDLDYDIQCEMNGSGKPPEYTKSLDAALTLVPKEMVWMVQTDYELPGRAFCHINDVERGNFDYRDGATPAIAICIAALLARSALTNDLRRP